MPPKNSKRKQEVIPATPPSPIDGARLPSRPSSNVASRGDTEDETMINGDAQPTFAGNAEPSNAISAPTQESAPPQAPEAASAKDSLNLLGAGVKVLLHAINDLARHGIDTTVPLPKIVVVGNQSAGKSSLIEAISDIKVPRDVGTCTRCPLQITLTSDESDNPSWLCNVSLLKRFDYYKPSQLPEIDEATGKPPPFYPWRQRDSPITTPFMTVRNKNYLETAIRAAQVATLNPGVNPKTYVGMDATAGAISVEFSPNLVCLDIQGPGLPNLTFYDLPGVIAQTDAVDPHPVKLVKNLVRNYTQEPNTLILLATPMDAEIENLTAASILRKAGAVDRCIGVITKPDRLPGNDRVQHWNNVLRGEVFKLGHGYFVTKQPSQVELDAGITHADAREAENAFFASSDWVKKFSGFDDRLGTEKLQHFLSDLLAKLILTCLPDIRFKVLQKLSQIEEKLEQLPEPPENALHVVTTVVTAFNHKLQSRLQGGFSENKLFKEWRTIKDDFHKAITQSQRPALLFRHDLGTDGSASAQSTPRQGRQTPAKVEDVITVDSDVESTGTPSKKRKGRGGRSIPLTPTPSRASTSNAILSKRFTLPEIRSQLDDSSSSGLPGGIDPQAVDAMILQTLENWGTPLEALFAAVENSLQSLFLDTTNEVASEWRTTALYRKLCELSLSFLRTSMSDLRTTVPAHTLAMEQRKPLTENEAALEAHIAQELEALTAARQRARTEAQAEAAEASGNGKGEERGRKAADKDPRPHLGPDPFQREVEAMARVRGYYAVAAARFVDTVCQAVEVGLFARVRAALDGAVVAGLGIGGRDCAEACGRLLEDDERRARERIALKEERARLERARVRLDELEGEFGGRVLAAFA